MKWYHSAAIGIVIACLYGITLAAAMNALSLASFMIYMDPYKIPIYTAVIVSVLALSMVLTYEWWLKIIIRVFFRRYTACSHYDDSNETDYSGYCKLLDTVITACPADCKLYDEEDDDTD